MHEKVRRKGCAGACASRFAPNNDAVEAVAVLVGDVWGVLVQSNAVIFGECLPRQRWLQMRTGCASLATGPGRSPSAPQVPPQPRGGTGGDRAASPFEWPFRRHPRGAPPRMCPASPLQQRGISKYDFLSTVAALAARSTTHPRHRAKGSSALPRHRMGRGLQNNSRACGAQLWVVPLLSVCPH